MNVRLHKHLKIVTQQVPPQRYFADGGPHILLGTRSSAAVWRAGKFPSSDSISQRYRESAHSRINVIFDDER